MDETLLDTDILSEVLKRKDQRVLALARQYLVQHQRLAFSAITVYEIVRGLKAARAKRQHAEFLKTVATSDVFPVSVPVLLRAAELWVVGRNGGHPHDDADLIIAATALEGARVKIRVLDTPLAPQKSGYEQRKVYDTTQPGRGNAGHIFGDRFHDDERAAVIEYLKTL